MPRDPLDRDYTPLALARVLVELLPFGSPSGHGLTILEPHVGAGAFAYAVQLHIPDALLWVNDLDQEAAGLTIPGTLIATENGDFLLYAPQVEAPAWTLGNPPFNDVERHVRHALATSPNVAFLLRQGFLASLKRIPFFENHRPAYIYHIQGRPSFREHGRTDASDYVWVVWIEEWKDRETVTRWVTWEKPKQEKEKKNVETKTVRGRGGSRGDSDNEGGHRGADGADCQVGETSQDVGESASAEGMHSDPPLQETIPTPGVVRMTKRLINPGQSEAGWHRVAQVLLCPEKHRLSQLHEREITAPLVKGSLIHVGLAHLYKQKQLRDKGKDESLYYEPHEAIAVLAMQESGDSDLWPELAPLAQRIVSEYEDFWGDDHQWRVLAVEKELRVMVKDEERWELASGRYAEEQAEGPPHLWTRSEKTMFDSMNQEDAKLAGIDPNCPVGKEYGNHQAQGRLDCTCGPPTLFQPARYLYTQRADLIVQHRKTKKVYIVDHKTRSRPIPSIARRHSLTGQFLGYSMFGNRAYGSSFGGVIVNAIRIGDEGQVFKEAQFARPKLERVINSHQKLKATIIHAERLIREYAGKPHWPHALQESACWQYGGCSQRKPCQFAEGEEE